MNNQAMTIANDLIFKLKNSMFANSKLPGDYIISNQTEKGLMLSVFKWGDFSPTVDDSFTLDIQSTNELEDIISTLSLGTFRIAYTDDTEDNLIIDIY